MSATDLHHDHHGSGWAATRELLRELRALMADEGAMQQRLDGAVGLVAGHLGAEVCSLYIMRENRVLELWASKGLRAEAVHRTRMAAGEGLVGNIAVRARPLALAEAQAHPDFAYRPETGEEIYSSFLGVPILRAGSVSGVLVVQNAERRGYTEADVELCETVAMVLAEMVGDLGMAQSGEQSGPPGQFDQPVKLDGLALSEGLAQGTAYFHQKGLIIRRIVADDPEEELERLSAALVALQSRIGNVISRAGMEVGGEEGAAFAEILETYLMFAKDQGWRARMEEAIRGGLTAEAAVQKVQDETRTRMLRVTDRYLRERLSDLDDLATRLLQHLLGDQLAGSTRDLPADAVVIARSLGPAELLDYDRERLRALVLAEGSPTAHVAIIARALGLPAVGRCGAGISQIQDGDTVVVDALAGEVLARPPMSVRAAYRDAVAAHGRDRLAAQASRDLPPVTRDGRRIGLSANAGLMLDLPEVIQSGADGIGLFRTELSFMVEHELPGSEAQAMLYRNVVEQMDGRPVVFRTLDLGGDKLLPAWQAEAEDNPALGWRALRIGLDRPELLRDQLRALVTASADSALRVMFPMVSEVSELERGREMLESELALARARGAAAPSAIEVGTMVEVPALLWQIEELLAMTDFVSVGSNDLLQFLFASDRGNPKLARRYDPLSPPVLRLLRDLARDCRRAGVRMTLCGEMAGRPLEALALIGCGVTELSMVPSAIPAVKAMVRGLNAAATEALVDDLLQGGERDLRGRLSEFAADVGFGT